MILGIILFALFTGLVSVVVLTPIILVIRVKAAHRKGVKFTTGAPRKSKAV